jgi:hypothetical protein
MSIVDNLFINTLGRYPDPEGKKFYEEQIASGAKTPQQVAAELQYAVDTGAENKALNQAATQQTIAAYKSVLGRDPTDPNNLDLEGLGFYTAKNINEGTGAVVNDLVYSQEGQQIEQAKIQTRQDEQQKIKDESAARAAEKAAARNNQIADTLQKTVDRAQAVGDTNTVNKLTDQIARLRGETTNTTTTNTATTNTTTTDPNRVQAVTDLYNRVFYRQPDAEGLAFYTTGDGKDIPLNQLEGTFRASPEGARVSGIENLYTNYLGRAPDAGGVRYYYDLFGDTIDDQELFFFLDTGRLNNENVSPEGLDFITNYTGDRNFEDLDSNFVDPDTTRRQLIENLYQTVFYRPVDAESLEYFMTGEGKNFTIDELFQRSLESPEALRVAQIAKLYEDYLGRAPDATGLRYWLNTFGETIDPNERFQFLQTAQQNNEAITPFGLEFLGEYVPSGMEFVPEQYTDYRTVPAEETVSPFGGYFDMPEGQTFNPFDYTGLAPTPGMYRGYDPFAAQQEQEINLLANQYLGGNFEPEALEFYRTQRSTGRSLADIGADIRYSPESQAFMQTRVPTEARAAIAPAMPAINPYVARDLGLEQFQNPQFQSPDQSFLNASLPVNPYAPPNLAPYGPLTPLTEFTYTSMNPTPIDAQLAQLSETGEDQGIVAGLPVAPVTPT